MNIDSIGFLHEPSIGILYLNDLKPTFVREKFTNKSLVYSRIQEMKYTGFDYAHMNDILIIEDTAKKRPIFECMVEDLPLSTQGDFIAFFHAQIKNNIWIASSLTLPDAVYLKRCWKNSDITFVE